MVKMWSKGKKIPRKALFYKGLRGINFYSYSIEEKWFPLYLVVILCILLAYLAVLSLLFLFTNIFVSEMYPLISIIESRFYKLVKLIQPYFYSIPLLLDMEGRAAICRRPFLFYRYLMLWQSLWERSFNCTRNANLLKFFAEEINVLICI